MGRFKVGLGSGVCVLLLFVALFGAVLNFQVVKGDIGTIYIRAIGSIDSPTPVRQGRGVTGSHSSLASSEICGVEWNKTYGGPGYDWAYSLEETSDGGFIVAGDTDSFGAGSFDAWLIKTDTDGNMQWNRTYGGEGVENTHSAIQTNDGGYAIGGWNSEFSLIKTDVNGNVQWNKTHGGNFESVIQTDDGGYALCGTIFNPSTNSGDFWLVKTDSDGNMQWNKTFGGADYDYAQCGIQTDDGGYAIAGYTYSAGEGHLQLVKTDANGDLQWNLTFGSSGFDLAQSVIQTDDGGYALAGWTKSNSGYLLVKTDSGGNVKWSRTYGGDFQAYTEAYSVIQTSDGGYALVGDNFRFIKTDSAGNLKWDQTLGGGQARSILQTDDGAYVIAGSKDNDFWLIKYNPNRVHNINTGLSYIFIQDAIDAPETLEGNTIKVDEDTYYEHVVMDKNNLTLVGEDPRTTVIDGGGTGSVMTITASNVTMSNFTVQHSGSQGSNSGIFLDSTGNCSISGNNVTSNNYAIYLNSSSGDSLIGNSVMDNIQGISLRGPDNLLRNNSMVGNQYNFGAMGAQDVDTSNTVDGRPIYYWVNRKNMQVPSDAGYVALIDSYNTTVEGLEISNNEQGISLFNTTKSLVLGNNISNSIYGIWLFSSSDNTVSSNNLSSSFFGVYLDYSSDNNTVSENKMRENKHGVGVATLGTTVVEKNEISNNSESGIMIVGQSNVLIKENTIIKNKLGIASDASGIHSGIAVIGNVISLNKGNGIYLFGTSPSTCNIYDVELSSNNISSNDENGIYIESYGNSLSGPSGYGHIYNVTLSSNAVSSNSKDGITLIAYGWGNYPAWSYPGYGYGYLHDVVFSSNNVSSNGGNGIYLRSEGSPGEIGYGYGYIYNVSFSDNTVLANREDGVHLAGQGVPSWGGTSYTYGYVHNVAFFGNRVLANEKDGLYLESYGNSGSYMYDIAFSSNIVSANNENGIHTKAQNSYQQFDLTIFNNTVSANDQKGIWIDGGSNSNLTYNSISYNVHGVFYETSIDNLAEYNDIYRNSYGMNITYGAIVNAENNYWGDSRGPFHESLNPDGKGNSVNGDGTDLDFSPFLTAPLGQINERPVAMLAADETRIRINMTVTFNASASTDDGLITQYFFDFGDGTNSSWTNSPVVTHKYVSQGNYNALLIVTDNLGITSLLSDMTQITITIIAPPVAKFTYAPELPLAASPVNFNASSSWDQDGTIVSYRWDFDDGNTAITTDPIIAHIYTAQGTYNISLTVTDNDGLNNSTTISITVTKDSASPMTAQDYDQLWHTSDFIITLTATDDLSGVAEIYYRINDGPIQNVSAYGQPLITTQGNSNTLQYWSVDYAGNEEDHHVLTGIELDETAPAIDIPSRKPEGDVRPDQSVKVSVNVADTVSGVKNVTLNYSLNNGTTWEEPLPMSFNASNNLYEATIPLEQADTTVRFRIVAYDNAGNNATLDGTEPYFAYQVIPEFPSSLVLPIFMMITLFAAIAYKRKRPSLH